MADGRAHIEHVVVLMLENRSFDHMLGFLGTTHGLDGDEFNYRDPTTQTGKVQVSKDAADTGDLDVDPSHSLTGVNMQLFGADLAPDVPPATTNVGFIKDYRRQPDNTDEAAGNIMRCFTPDTLPVLSKLAREFAVCDQWYSSVPSQTWPNRFFAHCASSGGFVDNQLRVYNMRTIYDNLAAEGVDWAIYFHDIPQSLTLRSLRKKEYRDSIKPFATFAADCKTNALPSYSFIEPRYFDFLGFKANDQHPPHDVSLGERLIATVYETLRNSQAWKSTLLIVTYDEHGGIYDHLLPPKCAAPGDAEGAEFDFTRLGPRVPAVLVSPYVKAGTVESDRQFDHTSILSSLKERFELPEFLTERDRHAPTFWHLVSDAFRDDTPKQLLPKPPAALKTTAEISDEEIEQSLELASREPLSEFQESLVRLANDLTIPETPRARAARMAMAPLDEHTAAVHVRLATEQFLATP